MVVNDTVVQHLGHDVGPDAPVSDPHGPLTTTPSSLPIAPSVRTKAPRLPVGHTVRAIALGHAAWVEGMNWRRQRARAIRCQSLPPDRLRIRNRRTTLPIPQLFQWLTRSVLNPAVNSFGENGAKREPNGLGDREASQQVGLEKPADIGLPRASPRRQRLFV
jgi:hypothetical protein